MKDRNRFLKTYGQKGDHNKMIKSIYYACVREKERKKGRKRTKERDVRYELSPHDRNHCRGFMALEYIFGFHKQQKFLEYLN